jgi:hypothetical protein
VMNYLTISEQAELLGEDPEDLCGCGHSPSSHVACALDPAGKWLFVHSRCLYDDCCLDAGGYYVDSPLAPDGNDWLVYQILPDSFRYIP